MFFNFRKILKMDYRERDNGGGTAVAKFQTDNTSYFEVTHVLRILYIEKFARSFLIYNQFCTWISYVTHEYNWSCGRSAWSPSLS